jgi:hypothetical protein
MRNYCASIKSAAMRWVHLFLIFILTLSVRTVRAEGNDPLPIEVIEALEELFPAFDPQMISSLEVPEKNLVNIECELGGQSFDLMLTISGELLSMRPSHSNQDKLPMLDVRSGQDIGIRRLPLRISLALHQRFPGITINQVQAVEQRHSRRRMFRIEAVHSGAEIHLIVNKHGGIVELSLDSDRDGISDVDEITKGLDRLSEDTDGDGFPDGIENDFLGNPSDASRIPTLLKLCHDCDTKVVVVTAQTFKGRKFVIEVSETGRPNSWVPLGEAIAGDGAAHDVTIPSDGPCRMTMFRLGITKEDVGARVRKDAGADESGDCLVPDSLVGREITIGGGRRLFFNMRNRGQLIEETGKGMIVTQFSYTFRRSGHCKAKVVLTFSVRAGFQTTVYNLTFTAEGDSGIFDASEYERGSIEDRFDGTFAITMNP